MEDKIMLTANLHLARGDARTLIMKAVGEVQKTGGERQRSEGLEKLLKAFHYLIETDTVPWEDYREEGGKYEYSN